MANSDEVSSALEAQGYSEEEISSAYSWLIQRFENAPEQYYSDFSRANSSIRVLSMNERVQISAEAYGFLLKLFHLSLIDAEQMEMILERSALFGPRAVDLDQMKLLASSVVLDSVEEIDTVAASEAGGEFSPRVN